MAEVREGFLCPICMSDLGDEVQLTVHFDEKHSNEDSAIVQNFKDFLKQAKKKIVQDQDDHQPLSDEDDLTAANFSQDIYGLQPSEYHPVSGIHYDILEYSDHKIEVLDKFDQFRLERAKRADIRAMDINKLIVRLERLMSDIPTDPVKRRSHEQSIVPWINEKDVALCPNCAKSFGMTRRKHHCRLCGGVMCEDCSDRVSFDLAQRLVNPATISDFHQDEQHLDKLKKSGTAGGKSKAQATYDGLVSNLVDLAGFADSQSNFRSCLLCKEVLDQRDKRLRIKTAPDPDLVRYYSRLRELLTKGDDLSEKYRGMANSLSQGEATANIEEVKSLQSEVAKIATTVDAISQKIETLEAKDEKTANLQKRIRQSAKNFVKETLVGLPKVPTEEELVQIKAKKAEKAARRIEEEKKSALEAKLKSESMKKSKHMSNNAHAMISNAKRQLNFKSTAAASKGSGVRMGSGFVANAGKEVVLDDPLGQQIYNIKVFIQQAKDAGKFDDARSLENNLRELQDEYNKVQQQLEQNYEEFKGIFGKSQDGAIDEKNPFFEDLDETTEMAESSNPFDTEENGDFDSKNPFA